MGFFESPVVQEEARQFMKDYQDLMQLGTHYGKFDRIGKEKYIEQMETLLERYAVFMKRMELSDDFMAQMAMRDLKDQLGNFGIQPQQMFDQMTHRLQQMKQELR
ncbi:DUF1825 family protein [Candidatus Cyanaurora vandensis]|uniref:DUF1825 family protein n=1 Tax=Candidatus Cyanaurora vandensis TaxID=2714958 RepID=UPI002579E2C4|nr:DUF1825 family protein [Candidatus Cyanaurora vandensis]